MHLDNEFVGGKIWLQGPSIKVRKTFCNTSSTFSNKIFDKYEWWLKQARNVDNQC